MADTRLALRLLAAALLWASALLASAAPAGQGYVDRIQLNGRHMHIEGWAASEQPQHFITQLSVHLGTREVYRGRMQGAERPDVAQATGRLDWIHSGLSARFMLPRDLAPGQHPLSVRVRRGDGQHFALDTSRYPNGITVPDWPQPSWSVRLALGLALTLPLLAWLPPWPGRPARLWQRPVTFALALLASFVLLVASGVTGSSLDLLLQQPNVTEQQAQTWYGTPRPIRSDEWEVITPLALAQSAHHPPWPIVNRNLGQDGQNMLVIGMTGMPVAHPTALAKPATWGYFMFDTTRALAWLWWLPLLGSLAAFWVLLVRLTGLAWRPAAVLATGLALAPYSVAFSSWPAYLALFATLGLLAFDRLLHAARWPAGLAWGALLGWSASAYALVLYPAWQVSLAVLCTPLALAWAWQQRAHWHWRWTQTLGSALALALAAWLMLSWWQDVRDTVALMRDTVYPGQRSAESGGDIDRWFLLKGWLNPLTLHLETPMVSSEAGSFQFLWLPTLALLLWSGLQHRSNIKPATLAIVGFVLFALAYQYIGFPAWVGRLTPWGHVTAYRLDLALGFAQLLLLGGLLATSDTPKPGLRPALATLLALATLAQGSWELAHMPLDIADALPAGLRLLALLAAAAAAALLALGQRPAFLALYVGWTLTATLPYHPLGRAPAQMTLVPPLQTAGLLDANLGPTGLRGTAVIGARHWAMTLPTTGVPVLNSVFYHPPLDFWQRLDPDGQHRQLYNRYQRLMIELEPDSSRNSPDFRIESPRLDEVRLWLDPARFDFARLGVRHVLLPASQAQALTTNPSLQQTTLPSDTSYALFAVRPSNRQYKTGQQAP